MDLEQREAHARAMLKKITNDVDGTQGNQGNQGNQRLWRWALRGIVIPMKQWNNETMNKITYEKKWKSVSRKVLVEKC